MIIVVQDVWLQSTTNNFGLYLEYSKNKIHEQEGFCTQTINPDKTGLNL